MTHRESMVRWFGAGVVAGAAVTGLCMALARVGRRAPAHGGDAATNRDPMPAVQETAADMFEYRGFVIHVFCMALGDGRYKSLCDIWESGAVVLESGGPAAIFASPHEAAAAGGAWARHWVQGNG